MKWEKMVIKNGSFHIGKKWIYKKLDNDLTPPGGRNTSIVYYITKQQKKKGALYKRQAVFLSRFPYFFNVNVDPNVVAVMVVFLIIRQN